MTTPSCPIHPKAEMRPDKPFRFPWSEPVPMLKCVVCAYRCVDQAPVAHPSSNGATTHQGGAA